MVSAGSLGEEPTNRNRESEQGPKKGPKPPLDAFYTGFWGEGPPPAHPTDQQGATRPARQGDSERSERGNAVAALDKNASRVSDAVRSARRLRYSLRDGLRLITSLPRVGKCGRCRVGDNVSIHTAGGRAHFSGLTSCGSVWACPVCAAKIAARRGAEVVLALSEHMTGRGGAELITLTLPHTAGDSLGKTRRLAAGAWKRVQQGRAWVTLKQELGIVGSIRSLEVTHGENGWHPHVHVLVFTLRPLTGNESDRLLAHAFTAWQAYVVHHGHAKPQAHCAVVRTVTDAEVGMYATKFGAAMELTQGASKTGRSVQSRTPFSILADFLEHGDVVDLDLWNTWEREMKGARQLTWSKGLKTRFAVQEVSDEDIASEAVGGDVVAVMSAEEWRLVVMVPGLRLQLLEAAEDGGKDAVERILSGLPSRRRIRLPLTPLEQVTAA